MAFFVYSSSLILFILSMIHVYWAFGGRWGIRAVLPVKAGETRVIIPGRTGTLFVAALLLLASVLLLSHSQLIPILHANVLTKWGAIVCASVFLMRAVGEFRYLGIFKRVKGTTFAKYDTWLFTPLCVYLSASFMMVL